MQSTTKWRSNRTLRVVRATPRVRNAQSLDDLVASVEDVREQERVDRIEVGLIARPWGATRSLRIDPAHPTNVSEVDEVVGRSLGSPEWGVPSGLFYVPAWVLLASENPRFVALPDTSPCVVVKVTGIRGSGFRPGDPRGMPPLVKARGGIPIELAFSRIRVLFVADALYAPGLVRPGMVLEAIEVLRHPTARESILVDDAAQRFRANYRGCVLNMVPTAADVSQSLPGQPLENSATVDSSVLRIIVGLSKREK